MSQAMRDGRPIEILRSIEDFWLTIVRLPADRAAR
jgi:hypothetical protein